MGDDFSWRLPLGRRQCGDYRNGFARGWLRGFCDQIEAMPRRRRARCLIATPAGPLNLEAPALAPAPRAQDLHNGEFGFLRPVGSVASEQVTGPGRGRSNLTDNSGGKFTAISSSCLATGQENNWRAVAPPGEVARRAADMRGKSVSTTWRG